MTRDVVVSGLGLMVPHGDDPVAVFAALLRGESALRELPFDLTRPTAAASVDHFEAARWFTRLQLAGVDRVSQLAVAAAELALGDAGLVDAAAGVDGRRPVSGHDAERIGVYVGCGMGGAAALDAGYATGRRVPPLTIPAFMPNAPAAHVAIRHAAHGPVLTYAVACASSAVAIAEAAKALRAGEVDLAIAGGSEALIVPRVVLAWQAMQTLATFEPGQAARAVRPFAADRNGFAVAEGAAFLVLEAADGARRRGARRYAKLAGAGIGCDATHLTRPDAAGQARAMRAALRQAGLAPRDVGYCNAHGTATRIGDAVECEALAAVWGADLDGLRVGSTKALHGHLLGAAGALEAAISVLALQQRQLPPNVHGGVTDPECALNLIPADTGLAAPTLQAVISNSFAFGGTNAALVFTQP